MERALTDRYFSHADIERAVQAVTSRTEYRPELGLVLGSGWSALADEIANSNIVPFRQVPGIPASTVEGHRGEFVIGTLAGRPIAALRGRVHYYEGYSMQEVTLPIRVLRGLGVKTLIVTNAAGGVRIGFEAGDVMLITDHINLVGMAGLNPLRGPNDDTLGPRFPDLTNAYDPALCEIARSVADELKVTLREGIYIMLAGPSYESGADVRLLRIFGADAVGMSTVPEVIVARHGGMRVLGLSLITNALGGHHPEVSHMGVLAAGEKAMPYLSSLVKGIVERI